MKSNLISFLDDDLLTSKEILSDYEIKIKNIHSIQLKAEKELVSSCIQIGLLLLEAKQYKDQLRLSNKEKLWKSFGSSLGFSAASVSRYISIAKNPILLMNQFHSKIPSSINSLYELNKFDPITLQLLIESGEITPTTGRSAIKKLVSEISPKNKSKKITKQTKQIDLMKLTINESDWVVNYCWFIDELLEFLNHKNINYVLSKKVKQLNVVENTYYERIKKYVFTRAVKFYKSEMIKYIDYSGRKHNLWSTNSKISVRKKITLLKFGWDEISWTNVINTNELKEKYIFNGLGDESTWYQNEVLWRGEASDTIELPDFVKYKNANEEEISLKSISDQFSKSSKSEKKYNFTGVKI